jgi:hypothetical protein
MKEERGCYEASLVHGVKLLTVAKADLLLRERVTPPAAGLRARLLIPDVKLD